MQPEQAERRSSGCGRGRRRSRWSRCGRGGAAAAGDEVAEERLSQILARCARAGPRSVSVVIVVVLVGLFPVIVIMLGRSVDGARRGGGRGAGWLRGDWRRSAGGGRQVRIGRSLLRPEEGVGASARGLRGGASGGRTSHARSGSLLHAVERVRARASTRTRLSGSGRRLRGGRGKGGGRSDGSCGCGRRGRCGARSRRRWRRRCTRLTRLARRRRERRRYRLGTAVEHILALLESLLLLSCLFLLLFESLETGLALCLLLGKHLFPTTDHVFLVVDLLLGGLDDWSRGRRVAAFGLLDLLLDCSEAGLLGLETVLLETSFPGFLTSSSLGIGLCALGGSLCLLGLEALLDAGVDGSGTGGSDGTEHAHALLHTALGFGADPSGALFGGHVLGRARGSWSRGCGSGWRRSGLGRLGRRRGLGRGGPVGIALAVVIVAAGRISVVVTVARVACFAAAIAISVKGAAKILAIAECGAGSAGASVVLAIAVFRSVSVIGIVATVAFAALTELAVALSALPCLDALFELGEALMHEMHELALGLAAKVCRVASATTIIVLDVVLHAADAVAEIVHLAVELAILVVVGALLVEELLGVFELTLHLGEVVCGTLTLVAHGLSVEVATAALVAGHVGVVMLVGGGVLLGSDGVLVEGARLGVGGAAVGASLG